MIHLLAVLATWRASHLIVYESEPFGLLSRLRHAAGVRFNEYGIPSGTNTLSHGLSCLWCVSVWVGVAIAILLHKKPAQSIVAGLAYSAGAIMFHREYFKYGTGHR